MHAFARSIKGDKILERFKRGNIGIAFKRIHKLQMKPACSGGISVASEGQKEASLSYQLKLVAHFVLLCSFS